MLPAAGHARGGSAGRRRYLLLEKLCAVERQIKTLTDERRRIKDALQEGANTQPTTTTKLPPLKKESN